LDEKIPNESVNPGGKKTQICDRMTGKLIKHGEKDTHHTSHILWITPILKSLSITYNVGTNSACSNFMRNKGRTWQKGGWWLFGQAPVTDVQV